MKFKTFQENIYYKKTGADNIAVTVRRTLSASDNVVYAGLLRGEEFAAAEPVLVHIVDRVGAGDAFSAGIVYVFSEAISVRDTLDFAVGTYALKHTVEGDINMVSAEEVRALSQKRCRMW